MIQFYKKRDFGTFISDSFNFFKLYGKNYFKNYILINGLLLILIITIFIFGYKELFSQIFGSNLRGETYYFEQYFSDNAGMLIVVGILTFFTFLLCWQLSIIYILFFT
ncbi:hypothetical protein [Chryseobacterium sp. P1-3]|uniref:hypothetical protein n=1 Tax=Chryseobacterium sp. (strain P1-3) TaxID=1517683 RepID=UPI000678D271|nr:hypothetical protein [Chryseobacterium sp. P1-3]